MNNNLTDITIVLDESGSMGPTVNDTIGGFNTLIQQQLDLSKSNPNSIVDFSLYTFSGMVKQTCSAKRLGESKIELNTDNYVPAGSTALLDAIGRAITETGERLRLTLESARPGKVLFVIITDGEENSSRHYRDYHQIADMIAHQQDVYNWEFVFIGANQDAIASGAALNIKAGNSFNYVQTSGGISDSYAVLNTTVTSNRLGITPKSTTAP